MRRFVWDFGGGSLLRGPFGRFCGCFRFCHFEDEDRKWDWEKIWWSVMETALRRELLRIQFDSETLFGVWKGGFMEEKWMLTWQRLQKVWPLCTVRMPSPGEMKDSTFGESNWWKQWKGGSGWFSLSVDSISVDKTLLLNKRGYKKWENRGCLSAVGRPFEVE